MNEVLKTKLQSLGIIISDQGMLKEF